MKVVQINSIYGRGSTGKICTGISDVLTDYEIENYIIYVYGQSKDFRGIKCAERFMKFQSLRSRILGNYGFNSRKTTQIMIEELEKVKPDIVHLHNLHSHNCNLSILMNYFRQRHIKLIWTFHDCWAFTAYCPHFVMAKCDKWKTGCHHCVQRKTFSWFFDRSVWLYEKKKKAFEGLDLTIVTPSKWLSDLVKQSFLKDYPVKVIHNGIDLNVFSRRNSDIREKYGIKKEQFLVLGVADKWVPRKGMDVFIRLAELLDSDKFKILLVGTDDNVDKQLPQNIISVHRTNNQLELAEIYSASDVFVNPTREDTFPTTHMESLACGTPVIAFNTGGCFEMLNDKCGAVVDKEDVNALAEKIRLVCFNHIFSREACIERARDFDQRDKFEEYIDLYE